MPKRKKYQENEERRLQDSPDGLVVAASKNRAFAERLVGVIRLALAIPSSSCPSQCTSAAFPWNRPPLPAAEALLPSALPRCVQS